MYNVLASSTHALVILNLPSRIRLLQEASMVMSEQGWKSTGSFEMGCGSSNTTTSTVVTPLFVLQDLFDIIHAYHIQHKACSNNYIVAKVIDQHLAHLLVLAHSSTLANCVYHLTSCIVASGATACAG
jgi:hypothetical protein